LLVEPWFGGSHRQWIEAYQERSQLDVQVLSLPARYWKWRMMGGAQSLARHFKERGLKPRRILASSMLDLPSFLGLLRRELADVAVDLYFHENQILYPWSPLETPEAGVPGKPPVRDNLYGYRNLLSALAADRVFFNSAWHRRAFLDALPAFLDQFPDRRERQALPALRKKSQTLYLGLDLQAILAAADAGTHASPHPERAPVLLWNHRWEHDKNPTLFFQTLVALKDEHSFKLVVLGQNLGDRDGLFAWAREALQERVLHWGPVQVREEYHHWLRSADIQPVTAHHDFFGAATAEALYAGCRPVLPNHWAYPELLPEHGRHRYLYEPGGDEGPRHFREALLQAFRDWRHYDPQPVRQRIGRYDWSVMAPVYDRIFSTPGE